MKALLPLVVDRTAFDKIIQAGGYISATTGGVPDANNILVPKHKADQAMDAAACTRALPVTDASGALAGMQSLKLAV